MIDEKEPGFKINIGDPDKDLLIIFSSYYHNAGIPIFEFTNFLAKNLVGLNYILLKDDHRCFYYRGVVGLSTDTNSTLTGLQKLIKTIEHNKVRTLGLSSGAAAAIRFGALLNVDQIDAFSTISFLTKELNDEYNDHRLGKIVDTTLELMDECDSIYLNINYLNNITFKSKLNVYYGSIDKLDKTHVDFIKINHKFNVIRIEDAWHGNIIKVIRDNGTLLKILEAL